MLDFTKSSLQWISFRDRFLEPNREVHSMVGKQFCWWIRPWKWTKDESKQGKKTAGLAKPCSQLVALESADSNIHSHPLTIKNLEQVTMELQYPTRMRTWSYVYMEKTIRFFQRWPGFALPRGRNENKISQFMCPWISEKATRRTAEVPHAVPCFGRAE